MSDEPFVIGFPPDTEACAAAGITFLCLVCNKSIDGEPGRWRSHAACSTCPVCGAEMEIDANKDYPTRVRCWDCKRRVEREAQEAAAAIERAAVDAATEMLLSASGTRETREKALEVITDYHFGMGCS